METLHVSRDNGIVTVHLGYCHGDFKAHAYRSVLDIPGEVTLAVVAVPADSVLEVVEECAAKHVRGLVVVSSGTSMTNCDGQGDPQSVSERPWA